MKQEMITAALFIIGWFVPEMCLLIGGSSELRVPKLMNYSMGAACAVLGYFLVG
jgi:hypothetical protein